MPKLTKITIPGKSIGDIERSNMLESLDALRTRIENGTTTRFGIVEGRVNGDYSTEFTSLMHKREDAAMLLDLALRMLGFVCKDKDDKLV